VSYTGPVIRATGDLITAAIWNAEHVANFQYFHGDAGPPNIVSSLIVNDGTSTRVTIGNVNTGFAGIAFGSAGDVILFRATSTQAQLLGAGGFCDLMTRGLNVDTGGTGASLTFGNLSDAQIKRVAASVPGGGSASDNMAFHRHPYGNIRHVESGTVALGAAPSSVGISFTDAFSAAPKVVATADQGGGTVHRSAVSTTGATLNNSTWAAMGASNVHWIAEGQD
jgi:hypothetical protein